MPASPRFLGAFISILALGLAGCTLAPAVEEPLRVGTVDDLTPEALGFRAGLTSLDEARATLQKRGLTGLVEDSAAGENGPAVSVLAADYQSRVFVFRDDRYEQALALPTHGLPPYGLAVRIAADGPAPSRALLVLYRDPLDRSVEPPTLLMFHVRDTSAEPRSAVFELVAHATFDGLVARHGGLAQPLLVGNDLADGVMLVARDRAGNLWETSYLLHVEAGKVTLEPRAMSEALRCSCVQRYASGKVSR